MPGAVGPDAARLTTVCDRDVWAEEVVRLMQLSRPFDGFVEYAKRVANVPDPSGLQSLQRAGRLRKSPGQRAGMP